MDIRVPFNTLLNFPFTLKFLKAANIGYANFLHQKKEKKTSTCFRQMVLSLMAKQLSIMLHRAIRHSPQQRDFQGPFQKGIMLCSSLGQRLLHPGRNSLLREEKKKGLLLLKQGITQDLPEEIVEPSSKQAVPGSMLL